MVLRAGFVTGAEFSFSTITFMGIENLMMDQGLRLRELSDYGGTFTWLDSQNYPCSLGADNEGTKMSKDGGGFTFAGQQTIVIRKSCLDPSIRFTTGARCTLTDKNGDASNMVIAPEGVKDLRYAWQLLLQSPNTGA